MFIYPFQSVSLTGVTIGPLITIWGGCQQPIINIHGDTAVHEPHCSVHITICGVSHQWSFLWDSTEVHGHYFQWYIGSWSLLMIKHKPLMVHTHYLWWSTSNDHHLWWHRVNGHYLRWYRILWSLFEMVVIIHGHYLRYRWYKIPRSLFEMMHKPMIIILGSTAKITISKEYRDHYLRWYWFPILQFEMVN